MKVFYPFIIWSSWYLLRLGISSKVVFVGSYVGVYLALGKAFYKDNFYFQELQESTTKNNQKKEKCKFY